jgi:hypothetical protein
MAGNGNGNGNGARTVVVVAPTQAQVPWGLRFAWFWLVGWWLGGLVALGGWALLVIGLVLPVTLPLGIFLLNRLPAVITLRAPARRWELRGGVLRERAYERPLWLRAVWFVLIGWWLSGLWIALAYLACLTIVGIPLAFAMFDRVATVTTLAR